MRKFFLFLLLLVGLPLGNRVVAAEWAVTDTSIVDGYYYICSNYREDKVAGKGYISLTAEGEGYCLKIKQWNITEGDGAFRNHLDGIFHIWKAEDGTFHIKNMSNHAYTYLTQSRLNGGQSTYIWGVGREYETYHLLTKDWGASTDGGAQPYNTQMTRQDKVEFPTNAQVATYLAEEVADGAKPHYKSDLVSADSLFFIRGKSNVWRWRIGGSMLVKVNSQDGRPGASWYVQPVTLNDEELAYLELLGEYTDILGMGMTYGKNPGNISSEAAANTFEEVMDEVSSMLENGATTDEYIAEKKKLKEAREEASKYVVTLNGYFYIKSHLTFQGNAGLGKYMTVINDWKKRPYATYNSMPGQYKTDSVRMYTAGDDFNFEHQYLAHEDVVDADVNATTAEESLLPDQFIWKITPREDGSYDMKNCGESSLVGDSTYYRTIIKRISARTRFETNNTNAICRLPMRGTPQQGSIFTPVQDNVYRITSTDNFYALQPESDHLVATGYNDTDKSGLKLLLWDVMGVPAERITPKFKLNCAITDAAGLLNDWKVGTWPGQIQESYVADLRAELAKAREVYAAGTGDMDAQTAALEKVYQATMAVLKDTDKVQNPIQEGLYRFICTDTTILEWGETHYYQKKIQTDAGANQAMWLERDGVERFGYKGTVPSWKTKYHLFMSEDGALYWKFMAKYLADENGVLQENPDYVDYEPTAVWELKKASVNAEGKQLWYVKNLSTGTYLGIPSSAGQVSMSTEPVEVLIDNNSQKQYLASGSLYNGNSNRQRGVFMFLNPEQTCYMKAAYNCSSNYIPETSRQTAYMEGKAVNALQAYSWQWLLEPLEGEIKDKLLETIEAKQRVNTIHTVIGDAEKALANTINYTLGDALITDAGWEGDDETGTYDPTKTQICMNQLQTTEQYNIRRNINGELVTTATFMNKYKYLIDGDLATYVHSRFSANGGNTLEVPDYNSMLVDLRTPKSKIAFKVGMRGNPDIMWGPVGGQPITYGATDYGWTYRPTSWVVYGANTSDISGKDTTWTEVAYIKDIPAIQGQRLWTSPMIETETPYQYYKFSCWGVASGDTYMGHPYLVVSEFQVYDAEEDTANSPATYNEEIKKAADAVKALLAEARAAYKAGSVSKELLENFQTAISDLENVAPDTAQLYRRIYDAKVLNDSTYVPDLEKGEKYQYGDVTADQKAAFETAIQNAEKAMSFTSHPTKESLQKAYEDINNAYFTLLKQRKSFELDKWYYIVSTEYQGYHCRWNWNWCGNQMVYACGDIPQAPLKEGVMGNIASPVRWGHYTNFNSMPEGQTYPTSLTYDENYDKNNKGYVDYTGGDWGGHENMPHCMWRIVEIKDSVYAIQNRANGLYLGRRQDLTNSAYNYLTLSKEPMPMQINLLGRGQYEVLPLDSTCAYYPAQAESTTPKYEKGLPLHSQGSDFHMVWWGSGTERGYNTGSAYTFMDIDEDNVDEANLEIGVKNNDIAIMSLPFALNAAGGLSTSLAEEANIYKLKSLSVNSTDSTTTIELTKITEAAAGEPFILVTGTPGDDAVRDSVNLLIDMSGVTEYDGTNKTVNGLVAAVYGDSIKSPGYGVFTDAVLKTTEEGKTAYVKGLSGYIDAKSVVAGTGNTDLTIKGSGILNSIEKIDEALRKGKVDVYTVDGKKVRSAVKETDADKGLTKGVYVIGKKKVLVK